MVYLHEVWLSGGGEPQRFRLDSDELFQAFQRWVQGDAAAPGRGFVFAHTEKAVRRSVVLNFAGVTCMTLEQLDEAGERRAMGFFRPG